MAKKTKKENTEVAPVAHCDQLNKTELAIQQSIQNCILTIRSQQVMLDRDLAVLYGVETRRLNEAVKRNIERFPEDFMFQLTQDEFLRSQDVTLNDDLRLMSQIATSNTLCESVTYEENVSLKSQIATSKRGGIRKLPYAFTEQGIAMLSSVLRSSTAVEVNIRIMRAFIATRRFINANAQVFQRLETIEFHQIEIQQQLTLSDKRIEHNEQQIAEVFRRFDEGKAVPTQGIFYDGQIYDAHSFVCDLIKEAKERIVVIDNYMDNTVLTRLAYRKANLPVTIFTKAASDQFTLDIQKHNAQYPGVEVRISNKAHDRFLIIDNKIYHLGASIKDLGKKIFAFSLMEEEADELLKRLEE